jgi:hypothetical protein
MWETAQVKLREVQPEVTYLDAIHQAYLAKYNTRENK